MRLPLYWGCGVVLITSSDRGKWDPPPSPCPPYLAGNAVRVFTRAETTDSGSAPARSLEGPDTGLCVPQDIAVDHRGQIYTLERRAINVYQAGSTGNIRPVRSIVAADSGVRLLGMGLDRQGNLYVGADQGAATDSGSITVFARGGASDRAPDRILGREELGVRPPRSVAVDADGRIYTATAPDTIRIVDRPVSGKAAPTALLAGPATKLELPSGLAIDSRGRLHVANGNGESVTVYAAGARGDAAPIRTITTSPKLGTFWLSGPTWLALDPHDTLFVLTHRGVLVYAPEATGNIAPIRVIAIGYGKGLAVGRDGSVYVTGKDGDIAVFAPGARDSTRPTRTIEKPRSWDQATVLAMGPKGDSLYVAGIERDAVTVYPPGAKGMAPAARKIGGWESDIRPISIAVGRDGSLYIANERQTRPLNAIRVYGPTADGYASPIRVLGGSATRLADPVDVAFDNEGYMYVANGGGNMYVRSEGYVTVYPPLASGNTAPVRTLRGPNTLLRNPVRLAFDRGDTLLVLNSFKDGGGPGPFGRYSSLTVYPPKATGDAAPARFITVNGGSGSVGSELKLGGVSGIAVDSEGSVYLTSRNPGGVAVYPRGASGDVAPSRLLPRSTTGSYPFGVAIGPEGELYVASWVGPIWDRWWWRNMEWHQELTGTSR